MEPRHVKVAFNDKLFKEIIALRREVFCGECGEKPQYIKDNRDENGFHVAYLIDQTIIGCGSIYDNGNGEFDISKIAVKKHYRNFGIGSKIAEFLKTYAKEQNVNMFVAELPVDVLAFFEKIGMPKTGVPVSKNGKKYIKCEENLVFDGAITKLNLRSFDASIEY